MSGRLDRVLVTPWQACGYRGKACRKRHLLIENQSTYLTVSVFKYTGQRRWNYAVQFREGPYTGGGMIVAPRAKFEGYTLSENKSMAIVDEFLTKTLKFELITLENMKRYKVMS